MIAGAGFAMMAWRLACRRTYTPTDSHPWPFARDSWHPEPLPMPDAEYYRIIDNAQVGWYDTPNGMTCYL